MMETTNTGLAYLQETFRGKRVLIFGYGREGKSTENFLKNHCMPETVDVFEGKVEDIDTNAYDVIMKSPGIVMLERRAKFTSVWSSDDRCYGNQRKKYYCLYAV